MNNRWNGHDYQVQQHYPPNHSSYYQMTPFQYYQKPTLPHMQGGFEKKTSSFGKQTYPMLQYFQTKEGEVDFEKVMYTVNQLASTYQQISPMFKSVGSLIKKIPR